MVTSRLEIEGFEKSYGEFRLGPLDLSLGSEVLAVLGPSGCGKTTLLSLVAGVESPDAGTVRLGGDSLDGVPPEARDTVLLFQDGALFPHLTARDNIAYAAESPEAVARLAETLEIEDVLAQHPETLSGGQVQRVALARALAAAPDLLLLDEPFANLDTPIKRRLRDELRSLLATLDVPVVYVTHDQRTASVIGDRVAVLADGTVRQEGPSTEVFESPTSRFVARFTGGTNVFEGRLSEPAGDAVVWGGRVLEASNAAACRPGESVWFCIRPERITVAPGGDGGAAADREPATDGGGAANVLPGRVTDVVFTGENYRVTTAVEGTDHRLVATASPSTAERQNLDADASVELAFSPVHVIEPGD